MIFFFKKGGGLFIGGIEKWEASTGVSGYTSASCPFKGAVSISVPWYTNASSLLIRPISILSLSEFWIDFCVAVWKPLQTPFSSDFICMESSRCLVSNGPDFVQSETTVVKISYSEWRWHKAETPVHIGYPSTHLFLVILTWDLVPQVLLILSSWRLRSFVFYS